MDIKHKVSACKKNTKVYCTDDSECTNDALDLLQSHNVMKA
jgi:hypothetical protein